jgi:hypothetical protein
MTDPRKKTGGELFIIDNADDRWKVHHYLHEWYQIAGRSSTNPWCGLLHSLSGVRDDAGRKLTKAIGS